MNKKKICFIAFLFMSVFCLNSVTNAIALVEPYSGPIEYDSFTDGFKFIINNDGPKTCTISGYKSKVYTNIIPDEINGYTVTRIGDKAFKNLIQITGEVSLPSTIISIGEEAFSGCEYLTYIHLNDGLKSIGDRAFSDCDGLKKSDIKIPSTVNSIGSEAFAYATLESITFTSKIAPIIEPDTFKNFIGKVYLPEDSSNYIGEGWAGSIITGVELMGDLDGNQIVNANDAAIALDLYKYGNVTEKELKIGDLDRNGIINANDAALILDIYKYGK